MSTTRELLLLFICCCFNGVFFNIGFFYSYNVSYVKVFYPQYPIYLIYTVIIPMDLGIMLMNAVYPRIIPAIGVNNAFRLFGVLVCVKTFFYIMFPHLVGLYFSYLLLGGSYQLMAMNIIYILNKKYKDNLVRYTGYVFTGTAVALVWGLVFTRIMNPDNEAKTVEFVLENGDKEHTFSREISMRFPYLCVIYAVCNLVVSWVISFLVEFEEVSGFDGNEDSKITDLEDDNVSVLSASGLSRMSEQIVDPKGEALVPDRLLTKSAPKARKGRRE